MKKIVHKNQLVITTLAVLIAVAGYISFDRSNADSDEVAKEANHSILIKEQNDLYAFFVGVIVMQLLSSEMSFAKGTYQDHVPVLKGRTNTF